MNAFERFSRYHHIWREDRENTIQMFVQGNPLLAEFESQILHYRDLELEINAEPELISVGALALYTGVLILITLPGHNKHTHTHKLYVQTYYNTKFKVRGDGLIVTGSFSLTADLKLALTVETRCWIEDFGHHCNRKYRAEMEQILVFVDEAGKKLHRQIKDLDDIRITMAVLKEIREHQISIDFQVGPIEVNTRTQ